MLFLILLAVVDLKFKEVHWSEEVDVGKQRMYQIVCIWSDRISMSLYSGHSDSRPSNNQPQTDCLHFAPNGIPRRSRNWESLEQKARRSLVSVVINILCRVTASLGMSLKFEPISGCVFSAFLIMHFKIGRRSISHSLIRAQAQNHRFYWTGMPHDVAVRPISLPLKTSWCSKLTYSAVGGSSSVNICFPFLNSFYDLNIFSDFSARKEELWILI